MKPDPHGGERDAAAFVVTGGTAFRVNLEALDTALGALTAAASLAEAVPSHLEAARAAVWRGACAASPGVRSFDAEAAELVASTGHLALDAAAAARGVAVAVGSYRAAEAMTAGEAGGRQLAMRGLVWGLVPPGLWRIEGDTPARGGAQLLRSILAEGSTVPPLVPWVPAGRAKDPISIIRAQISAGAEDASTFAYAGRSLQQAQRTPSSILVERIPRTDGSTAVMVTVPGTQTWSLDDPSGGVFDTEGNLDAMAGRDSHVRQLIARALADQQVRTGDAIVFNAHSQGSLHVFGLLEDPDFRARYPVAAVTVLGGVPTAFRVPEEVAVLSIANRDDVVPGLSGLPPVPRPNVVDVQTPSHSDIRAGGLLKAVVDAHDLDAYAADARALDGSTNPSVRGYAEVLGAIVGTGIVGAAPGPVGVPRRERFVYTGTDTATPAAASSSSSSGPQPSPSAPRRSRR
ncbi:hypothetical protein GCM10027449_09070 [Sinomonas notoginsengisoli]|uniref:hypothetical protein n=1 Tax=Sinomonas notoginsengisoli TaxID=1457311 RepID=UPI001F26CC7C|nr:hypothetical protein [Sinomonas notoginsengisoli]